MRTTFAGLSFLFLLFPGLSSATELSGDPYASIERIKLENGLLVYLAPSPEAKLVSVRLEVAVGTEAESAKDGNLGVSHLLEHVLFRDKNLKDEMTYLQVVREAGGEANGQTQARMTSFFASIPMDKGQWLLEKFGTMLLSPEITDDYVQKEKGTVELERGRPSPLAEVLHFDLMKYLTLRYLSQPNFYQTEFGVKPSPTYTLTEEQLSTRLLTTQKVKEHYQNYYYPANMKLFVAGNFSRAKILELVQKDWATLPSRSGLSLPALQKPKPRVAAYEAIGITDGTPNVELGAKLWGLKPVDEEIIHSYVDYLAHRLMKEVRNLKGQTYTASGVFYYDNGYGYTYLDFQTQAENFSENLKVAQSYLNKETVQGALSEAQVDESKKLYLASFGLMGREAQNMMWLAVSRATLEESYGTFTSPYRLLQEVSAADYNTSLKTFFAPDHAYEVLQKAPPFRYDRFLFIALTAIGTFIGLRRLLTKKFQNNKIRWVRKIKYPPLKLFDALVLIVAYYGAAHVNFVLEYLRNEFHFSELPVFVSTYLSNSFDTVVLLSVIASIVSLFPRKLMVMDRAFVIKSLSYYSRHVPLAEIESVEIARLNPLALRRWWRVKMRFAFYNPLFWQPGLLVNLKNGKSFFFSVRVPEEVLMEVREFLPGSLQTQPQVFTPEQVRQAA